MPRLRPVVLSGGSGTRLWPLSTPDLPKQFAPLFGHETLFGMTLSRLEGLPGVVGTIVVTGTAQIGLARSTISSSRLAMSVVLIEPVGRNTAPAALAAAMLSDPGDVLVILPSDHLVADVPSFQEAVLRAADVAERGGIVTFGVSPSRPETGYGYIEIGERQDGVFKVERFREKPDEEQAIAMVADGRHLWNSGMFVARAGDFLDEGRVHCPDIVAGVAAALPQHRVGEVELGPSFASLEPISIDYAIMEKTERAFVLPVDVGWDDVGSYRSLLDASPLDQDGNHVSGAVTVSDVAGSYIKATWRRVVVAGLRDVVVVETPDAVLVVPIDRAQEVRDLQQRAGDD